MAMGAGKGDRRARSPPRQSLAAAALGDGCWTSAALRAVGLVDRPPATEAPPDTSRFPTRKQKKKARARKHKKKKKYIGYNAKDARGRKKKKRVQVIVHVLDSPPERDGTEPLDSEESLTEDSSDYTDSDIDPPVHASPSSGAPPPPPPPAFLVQKTIVFASDPELIMAPVSRVVP